jgi:hypothetical protein
MDEVYRNIYSQLYDSVEPEFEVRNYAWYNREAPQTTTLNAGILRQMIDVAERETFGGGTDQLNVSPYAGRRLRPDAKLFLLINFLQMIVIPVILARRQDGPDLGRILFADTVTLLKESADETNETDVSSHSVLKALTKNWQRLNVSALKLWED